jgi:hypothetical protein
LYDCRETDLTALGAQLVKIKLAIGRKIHDCPRKIEAMTGTHHRADRSFFLLPVGGSIRKRP